MDTNSSHLSPAPVGWKGSGTVMVVDDQDLVRSTAAHVIARFGFTVLEAESGEHALTLCEQRHGAIDLVLLDVSMPGMDGFATLEELRKINANLPVILYSGYSHHNVRERLSGLKRVGFVQKPFTVETLRDNIRHMLDR